VAVRMRQQRGLEGVFSGPARRIEEAIWRDFFYNHEMKVPIRISLFGDGIESRSLEISRGTVEMTLPYTDGSSGSAEPISTAPVIFTWTDAEGVPHSVTPKLGPSGFVLPDTGEDFQDFLFFPATGMIGAVENAGRFSELSKENRHKQFVHTFTKEYPWIKDINVEVHAGAPVLFATLKENARKVALPNVSTGINRALSYMLGIAARPKAIVLVDEIENGIYYSHMAAMWRSTISLLREYETQMFVSTHSRECIVSLVEAAKGDVADVALWRTERRGEKFRVRRFSGEDFVAGIEYGEEIR
jgi:AAA domain, putative AbiEii toxin, Type IV TA system